MAVGEYHATITVSKTFGADPVRVNVNLNVIEPVVMGPIMIGMEGIFPWSPVDVYDGFSLSLLTGDEGLDNLSGAAIQTGNCFELSFERGDPVVNPVTGEVMYTPIASGTIGGGSGIPNGELSGVLLPLSAMGGMVPGMELPDSQGMWVIMAFVGSDVYMGILIEDLGEALGLLPVLTGALEGAEGSLQPLGLSIQDGSLTIPLDPIMDLLPLMLPMIEDLLANPTVINLINAASEVVPPIVVLMPQQLMLGLFMP